MTPEQQAALEGVQGGDLILLILPAGLDSPQPHEVLLLLLVDSVRRVGMMSRRVVYVRGPESLQPQDWIAYRRGGSRIFWRHFQRGRPATGIGQILSDEDVVLRNPTFDELYHTLFGGSCPFVYCHEGLVSINSATRSVLQDTAEVARRYGFDMQTVCPFCMGAALYRDHESEVDRRTTTISSTVPRDGNAVVSSEEHIQRINARRSELGYSPLALQTALNNLRLGPGADGDGHLLGAALSDLSLRDALHTTPGAESTEEPTTRPRSLDDNLLRIMESRSNSTNEAATTSSERTSSPSPTNSPPSPTITAPTQRPGAVVATLRAREWYVKAATRVLGPACCAICLERFQPGAVVADLPCWHFFHAECWARVREGKCPFRCNE